MHKSKSHYHTNKTLDCVDMAHEFVVCPRPPVEPFSRSPAPDELERAVIINDYYRRVLYTSEDGQVQQVAMHVSERIPEEVHTDTHQYFLVKLGTGHCIIDGKKIPIRPLSAFWVEKGSRHEIQAHTGDPLKLFVTYTPAHHPRGRKDEQNVDLMPM